MNDRFMQFYKTVCGKDWRYDFDPDLAQEFAESIVKACAQFVEEKFDFCGDEIWIAERLREHFEVEENQIEERESVKE